MGHVHARGPEHLFGCSRHRRASLAESQSPVWTSAPQTVFRLLQRPQRMGSESPYGCGLHHDSHLSEECLSVFSRTPLSLGLLAVPHDRTWLMWGHSGVRLFSLHPCAVTLITGLQGAVPPFLAAMTPLFPLQLISIWEGTLKPWKYLIPHQTTNLFIFIDTCIDSQFILSSGL